MSFVSDFEKNKKKKTFEEKFYEAVDLSKKIEAAKESEKIAKRDAAIAASGFDADVIGKESFKADNNRMTGEELEKYRKKEKTVDKTLLYDGREVGKVSNAGYKALKNDKLDIYEPVNDEERAAISKYKEMIEASPKKNKLKISSYVPKIGETKEQYNERRAADSSLPEFGSKEYFIDKIGEVGELLDAAERKVSDHKQIDPKDLAKLRESDPERVEKIDEDIANYRTIADEYAILANNLKKFEPYSTEAANGEEARLRLAEAKAENDSANRLMKSFGTLRAFDKNIKTTEKDKKAYRNNLSISKKAEAKISRAQSAVNKYEYEERAAEVFERYGLDAENFDYSAFGDWANEHNYEFRMNSGMGNYYPKYKDGKKIPTEQEEKDFQILNEYAALKTYSEAAKQYPTAMSLITIAGAPVRGIAGAMSTVEEAVKASAGANVGEGSRFNMPAKIANAVRETVAGEYASKWFGGAEGKLGNYGELVYNGLMSVGDNVVNVLTVGKLAGGMRSASRIASNLTSALMASDAAATAIIKNKERGLSDGKAVALGVAQGASEYITEKLALDNIFDNTLDSVSIPKLAKAGLANFISEGGEEIASNHMTRAADLIINQSDAEIIQKYEEYRASGMSQADAFLKMMEDILYEDLSAGLVGGISGAAMGGAYGAAAKSSGIALNKSGVDSAYINKKGVTQVPNDEISSLGFTSETELASPPNNMIAQNKTVVNNKNMQNMRNNSSDAWKIEREAIRRFENNPDVAGDEKGKAAELASDIAKNISENIGKVTKQKGDYAGLINLTSEFANTENPVIDANLVRRYAEIYAESISPESSVVKAAAGSGRTLAEAVTDYVVYGEASESFGNSVQFKKVAEEFKKVFSRAMNLNLIEHQGIYGQNDVLTAQVNSIVSGDYSFMTGVAKNSESVIIDNTYTLRDSVAYAMEESLADDALGKIVNRFSDSNGNVDMGAFIDRMANNYLKKGNMGIYAQLFKDGGAKVVEAIKNTGSLNETKVGYSLSGGVVFPQGSQASEVAIRWAHDPDIENGSQKIVFFRDNAFLIEKFDSLDLGYQIVRKLRKNEYSAWKNQVDEEDIYGKNNTAESGRKTNSKAGSKNKTFDYDRRVESGSDMYADGQRGEDKSSGTVDRVEDGRREFEYERERTDERSIENWKNEIKERDDNEHSGTVQGRNLRNSENLGRRAGKHSSEYGERIQRGTGRAEETAYAGRTEQRELKGTRYNEISRGDWSEEMSSLAQETADKYGIDTVYYSGEAVNEAGDTADAFYYEGVLYLQADGEHDIQTLRDHEVTHHAEGSEAHRAFKDAVKKKLGKDKYNELFRRYTEKYRKTLAKVLERAQEKSGNTLTDDELNRIAIDYIDDEILANVNAGTNEYAELCAEEVAAFRSAIENKAEAKAETTTDTSGKAKNKPGVYKAETDVGGTPKFGIRNDNKGGKYWEVETEKDIFRDITNRKELQKAAYEYILRGEKGIKVEEIIDGRPLLFTRIGAKEYVYGPSNDALDANSYDKKMRMAPSVLDLIENANDSYHTPDHKEHKFAKDGFENYRGRVRIDDVIFTYVVRVGQNDTKNMFYDINLEVESTLPGAKARQGYKNDSTSTDRVPQNETSVNSNSMQEGEKYAQAVDEKTSEPKIHLSENGYNAETDAGGEVKYSFSEDEKDVLATLESIKNRRGILYNNRSPIIIPNSDMEVLRHTYKTEEHYSNRSDGIIDCIACSGKKDTKHYFYVFYKGEDGSVAPIFRMDYKYIDRYINEVRNISKELGYSEYEFITGHKRVRGNFARLGRYGTNGSIDADAIANRGTDEGNGERFDEVRGQGSRKHENQSENNERDSFRLPDGELVRNQNEISGEGRGDGRLNSDKENIETTVEEGDIRFNLTSSDPYSTQKSDEEIIFKAKDGTKETLSTQIDKWLKGNMKSNESFDFGDTPFVLQALKVKNLPVVMSQDTMAKITGVKHPVSLENVRNIADGINDPLMVFKSATVDNAFVLLTELEDMEGKPIIAAIHMNKVDNRMRINKLASVYGKDGARKFVTEQFKLGNVKYLDKIKSQEWSTSRGLQLPKLVQSNPDNNNILQKEDIVKIYYAKKHKNDTVYLSDNRYTLRDSVASAMEESLAENALGRIANRFADENNELRSLYSDNISEYFNSDKAEADAGPKFHFVGLKNGKRSYRTDFPKDMDFETKKAIFKERVATIFNLGAVELKTDTKKIVIKGDKFTALKNLYGDEYVSDEELEAKVSSLYDLADILSTSKFSKKEIEDSYADSNIKPKNKAHSGVKYWYKFENRVYFDDVLYNVTFNIRDKGKEQYQYLIEFRELNKKTTHNSHTAQTSLLLTNELPSDKRIPQNVPSVNSNSMQEGEKYAQAVDDDAPGKIINRLSDSNGNVDIEGFETGSNPQSALEFARMKAADELHYEKGAVFDNEKRKRDSEQRSLSDSRGNRSVRERQDSGFFVETEKYGTEGSQEKRGAGERRERYEGRTTERELKGVVYNEISREDWSEEMSSLAQETADKYGIDTVYYSGEAVNEAGDTADAFYYEGVLYLQADGEHDIQTLRDHEVTHHAEGSEAHNIFKKSVKKRLGKERYNNLFRRYTEKYRKTLAKVLERAQEKSGNTLTDDELNRIAIDYIDDEILANVNAGTNEYAELCAEEVAAFRSVIENKAEAKAETTTDTSGKAKNKPGVYKAETDAGRKIRYALYDYTKPFSEQIDDWKKGLIPPNDTLMIGKTPKIYIDVGFNPLPITINQTHVDYAVNGSKDADHHIGEQLLKTLPKALENPIAIIKSETKKDDSVVAILKLTHNGKSVVAPFRIDGFGVQNSIFIDSNAIKSVLGKGNAVSKLLTDAIQEEQKNNVAMFYWNKKEAVHLLQVAGNQFPGSLPQDGFIHSIRDAGSNVNMKISNVTESQQFKRWFGNWVKGLRNSSKVVNDDGTPKVVYHGSYAGFTVFGKGNKHSQAPEGAYFFTDDEDVAYSYTGYKSEVDLSKVDSGDWHPGGIYPVYLNMRKPYVVDFQGKMWSDKSIYGKDINEIVAYAKDNNYDGVIAKNIIDEGGQGDKNRNERNPVKPVTDYIVFEPTQIKSATDNIGTFDRKNPDIRFNLTTTAPYSTQKIIEAKALATTDEEFIEAAKSNTQQVIDYVRQNKDLAKRLENAKRQMTKAKAPRVNVNEVAKVTKEIISDLQGTVKAADLKDEITAAYNEYYSDVKKAGRVQSKVDEATDRLVEKLNVTAAKIINSAEATVEHEDYAQLREWLKETRIKVPDEAKAEAEFADKRKAYFGTLNLTNDGIPIDSAYQELCELFPYRFDESIAAPAEQLNAIADALKATRPDVYNPYAKDMESAIEYAAYRFVSALDGIAVMPDTKADRAAKKAAYDKEAAVERARKTFEDRMAKSREKNDAQIAKLREQLSAAKYTRYWERRLSNEERTQAVKEIREKRQISILKSRIRKIVSELNNGLNKTEKAGGYPKELVKAVAEVCSVIDFHTDRTAKDGSPTKVSIKLDELKAEYDNLKNGIYADYQSEYNEELSDNIAKLSSLVKGKRVVDLNVYELENLKTILSEIKHRLVNATRQIGIENARANAEIGSEIIETWEKNDDLISAEKNRFAKELRSRTASAKAFLFNPHRVNEMLAGYDKKSAWWGVYDQLNRGVRKAAKFTMDATMPFDELTNGNGGNEVAYYKFRTELFDSGITDTNGNRVKLTKAIMCELVMAWERNQGKVHLENGGFKIPDIKMYNKGQTSKAFNEGSVRTRPITQADITRIRGMLDAYDLEWIKAAKNLFDNVSKKAINETSMELLGREAAKAKNYIRLHTDMNFVKSEIDGLKADSTIEGAGSLKSVVQNANQPIILRGLSDNVYEQIAFTSKYYGLAIPLRNFNKVYNVSITDKFGNRLSVQETLGKKFGSKIQKEVVERMVKELQSPRDKNYSAFDAIRGNWMNATFWGNMRSMIKQTTSYWTASSILSEASLVKGLGAYAKNGGRLTREEVSRYSGSLYKREQGLSTTELGERAERKRVVADSVLAKGINKYMPWIKKIPEGLRPGNWLQAMDCSVASALWEACKAEIRDVQRISEGSEGYFEAVTDLYDRVIEETQSNYDLLHRPEALKSTNVLTQTVTMFQTDNLQQTGIIYGAFGDYKTKAEKHNAEQTAESEAEYEEAKKRLAKAVRSRIYSAVWLSAVTVAGDMLLRKFKPYRDEEENDVTWFSTGKRFLLNIGEDMFGVFAPIGSGIVTDMFSSFVFGYDFMTEPAFDSMQNFVETSAKLISVVMDEDGEGKKEKVEKALDKFLAAAGTFTGVPYKNMTDWYKAIAGYFGDIKGRKFAHDIADYAPTKSLYSYGDLAASIASGDAKQEDKILEYYKTYGKSVSKGALTRELKAAYVDMMIEEPERAAGLRKKLVKNYGYETNVVDGWVYDVLGKEIISGDEEGQARVKGAVERYNPDRLASAVKADFIELSVDDAEAAEKVSATLISKYGVSEVKVAEWRQTAESEKLTAENAGKLENDIGLADGELKAEYSYGELADSILGSDTEYENDVNESFEAYGKGFSKSSLTKEIKPGYVEMVVSEPEKAASIRQKLVDGYGYDGEAIDEWIYGYLGDAVVAGDGNAAERYMSAMSGYDSAKLAKAVRSDWIELAKADTDAANALADRLVNVYGVERKTIDKWNEKVKE